MARKYNYALIDKETLAFICSQIGVTTAYFASKMGLTEDKIALWLDVNDTTLPTINQAKDIAKALKTPFTGLYMKKDDVKIDHLPTMRNLRTVLFGMVVDDSALNIAIADLIRSRDFLFSMESELGVENTPVSLPNISDNTTPADAASIIRTFFGLNLPEFDLLCGVGEHDDHQMMVGIGMEAYADAMLECLKCFPLGKSRPQSSKLWKSPKRNMTLGDTTTRSSIPNSIGLKFPLRS